MAAEMAGGTFVIESKPGVGTKVRSTFQRSHIDRPPLGNMAETITAILQGYPDITLLYNRSTDHESFDFDSEETARELREALALDEVPLDDPEVLRWIREYIEDNEKELTV
jgi:hypothetical protein